jgi:phage FluMu gp28-like protein
MSVDQARHRDIPFVIELHKVPTRQQKQILFHLLRGLPRFIGAALDATGNGETLAEETADTFGHNRIHQVKISRTWYGAWMPKFVQLFEDAHLTLPRDDSLHQDLRAIETIDGIPMISKARQQDLKDPDLYRHGDFAGAGALAHFATLEVACGPITVKSRRPRQGPRITQGYA